MARPINEEMKKNIEKAAFALFDEVGYDKATYAAIAKRVGISRNLTQYHFPKKEMLAISYMENLIAMAQESLGITDKDIAQNPEKLMSRVGTCFFELLLENEGRRTFLLDIIRSRDLTEDVLAFNAGWAFEHLENTGKQTLSARAQRAVIVNMGGFYELLYHCLKANEHIDISSELKRVIEAFLSAI